jgi:hypothetical protein
VKTFRMFVFLGSLASRPPRYELATKALRPGLVRSPCFLFDICPAALRRAFGKRRAYRGRFNGAAFPALQIGHRSTANPA